MSRISIVKEAILIAKDSTHFDYSIYDLFSKEQRKNDILLIAKWLEERNLN